MNFIKIKINLIKIIGETNKYGNQNGQNVETTKEEVLAFLEINFIMAINRLDWIEYYWSIDQFMGQKSIQNVKTRIRFPAILQKFDFADGQKKDQTDKGSKVETVIKQTEHSH